ncbi:hypothetical protein ACFY4B_09530 [Kitasatospora sp. NPDC001261]|uniref:hypothetical protein n=1 Tax=Kitasatospora sp. NPDC001261 TaxID=3364012 RepID=UPI00368D0AA7
MALSPSLAPRPAAEASRPETARTVNGRPDGAEGTEAAQGAQDDRQVTPEQQAGASVPAPAQRSGAGVGPAAGVAAAGQTVQGGRSAAPAARTHQGAAEEPSGAAGRARPRGRAPRRPSGRERHDEKITVYVSAEELMDLEHARLVLRGEHGLAVDRGRIVREAIAVVLADLEQRGEASILVRRLRGR